MPARRIALLIHALFGGGAERLMSELASRWALQHEVHLITWSTMESDEYPLASQVQRHGLGLQSNSTNKFAGVLANVGRVSAMRRKLREIQPDFVLSFADQMNIVALEAARPLHVPVWISEHSDPAKQSLGYLWEKWRQRGYRNCSGCVVLTQTIANTMARLVPSEKIRVIPPAIHPAIDLQQRPCEVDRDKTILFVGRLSQEKRVDVLLEAWRQIQPSLPEWKLVIVGDGSERERLESLATDLPRLAFAGWCKTPRQFYEKADLFVLTSQYEGFPVALLEALEFGLPSIVTDCTSALRDMNAIENCVHVIPIGSVADLRKAILDLASDRTLRQSISDASRRVASTYHWQKIGKQWDRLLDA